jgi:tripartite-type tricarboxylate transporter receptor subunit TctC
MDQGHAGPKRKLGSKDKTMFNRRQFLLGSSALAMGAALSPMGIAHSAPSTGRLVFGLGAGATGGLLANKALNLLDQEFHTGYRLDVMDSRNTQAATEAVKVAPPDGMTLLQAQSSSMVLFPCMYRSLNYDPLNDFEPLAIMGEYTYCLTVGPAVPTSVTTLDGYLAWVSKNPEYRDIGSVLYGSQSHLISLMLARGKEVAIRPQSYKSPISLINDLDNKSLAAAITLAGTKATLGKNLRVLAVSSKERLQAWPEVATFIEQKTPEIDIIGWYGWFAPDGMPAQTAKALREKIVAIQATPDYVALQKTLLLNHAAQSPAQISERISKEIADYRALVARYGLTQLG